VIAPFFVWVALFTVLQNIVGRRSSARNQSIRQREPIIVACLIAVSQPVLLLGIVSILHDWFVSPASWIFVRVVGCVVILAGLAVSMWAQRCLGPSWVGGIGTARNHRLVTNGPYRYVRHPLYAGMLISGLGVGFVSMDPFYGLGTLLFAVAYILRYPAEEQALRHKFRRARLQEYEAYIARTPALFPHLPFRNLN
jgi:protein-S-isoprenylcysteine O-methyltransferase Ste14